MFNDHSWLPLSRASKALQSLAIEGANLRNRFGLRCTELHEEAYNNFRQQLFWVDPNFSRQSGFLLGSVFFDLDAWFNWVSKNKPQSMNTAVWDNQVVVAIAIGSLLRTKNDFLFDLTVAYAEEFVRAKGSNIVESLGLVYIEYGQRLGIDVTVKMSSPTK